MNNNCYIIVPENLNLKQLSQVELNGFLKAMERIGIKSSAALKNKNINIIFYNGSNYNNKKKKR